MGKKGGRYKRTTENTPKLKPIIKHKKPDQVWRPDYKNCVRCDNYHFGHAEKGIKLCSECAGDWVCNCEIGTEGNLMQRLNTRRRMGIEVVCNDCGALKPVTKLCPHCRIDEPTRIPEYYDCCFKFYCIDDAKEELEYYGKPESELKVYNPMIDKTIVPIKGRYARD